MDKKVLFFNLGFFVAIAAAIHHISSWTQDPGSKNPARLYTYRQALNTQPKYEISLGSRIRRWTDPMQSDAERRSKLLQPREQTEFAYRDG